jgi:glycosyltransferase involved in cell wall biosynthesis
MKKILIVSQYFWPEEFRINDLALDLVKRGFDVSVLTANPNYPKGSFVKGYGFRFSKEKYCGITIYRVPIIPRGKNGVMLLLNYFSFVIFGSLFGFFHKKRYDKVFAVNYSPITAVIPGIVYCAKKKVELSIWVQDLWPESILAASSIKYKPIISFLDVLVKWIYKKSNRIFVSNKGFINSIATKGVDKNKLLFMPNWAEDLYESSGQNRVPKDKYDIPDGFVIMFAGNMGESQDFDSIIKAIKLTSHKKEIKWIFVGDGRKKQWFYEELLKNRLEDNVRLLGRHPMIKMPVLFSYADIMLVTLKDEDIFALTVPGKIQSYMASSKPILSMLPGVGNELVEEATCGFTSKAEDYNSLANNAITAFGCSKEKLEELGVNGNKYYNEHYAKDKVIDNFIDCF